MGRTTVSDFEQTLEQLQEQNAELRRRLEALEKRDAGVNGTAVEPPAAVAAPQPAAAPIPAEITEEELLVISAAIGAFLGVRAHIRQIRLLSSNAWAQQGRVSIQASHSLQG